MKLILNFVSKLGVDSVSRLIGFITLPLITRLLGPEGYGQFTYLFVILSYFGFFIDFGYINYGTNKLCDKIDSRVVIGKIISLQIITAAFSFIVLLIVSYFFLESDKYILLVIFSATFISQIFSIKYYYLAAGKLYFNSVSELAGQLIYTALIFIFFTSNPSVLFLIIISVIQSFVTAMFLYIPYSRNFKIRIDLSISKNIQTLKDAYKLGLASKAEAVTASFIILCAGFFLNEESVGIYNASYKIYVILLTVVQGVSFTLMPMLLKNVKNTDKGNIRRISFIFYIYLFTGIMLFLPCFFFPEKIIEIVFGIKFMNSASILKNFSFTILIWPTVMFMSLVILAFNRLNYILITSLSSAFFSVIFSIVLIKSFGIQGAGYVLPFVAICTIAVSIHFLKRISSEENFRLRDLFSLIFAFREINTILIKRK